MKVHLIKKQTVMEYCRHHSGSLESFQLWLDRVSDADWRRPKDILSTFSNADLLGNASERVIFNIGGNNYRVICAYYFGRNWVQLYIRWIGTHAEYDKLCGANKQFTI